LPWSPSKLCMGNPHVARVDTDALASIARDFDETADLIERAARTRLVFDGATAGRAYTAHGDELRRSLEMLIADLSLWSRAAAEIAAALRIGADRYRDADFAAAAGVG
jgi:Excreted virulence factor EspC, type VII ESX diderm